MMKKLMLSCQAATGLVEKKHSGKISFLETLKLAYHNKICIVCRHYEEQSRLIEHLFKSKENAPLPPELEKEAAALEEKILQQLEDSQK